MNKLLSTLGGGMPLFLNDLNFIDLAYRDALFGIMSAFGITEQDSFKLSGCVVAHIGGNDFTCTAGYISFLGEIYQVKAHNITTSEQYINFAPKLSWDAEGNKVFKDASTQNTYQIREAELVGSDESTMPYNAPTLHDIIATNLKASNTEYSLITGHNVYYRKDAFSVVTLQGVINYSETVQLPSGHLPSSTFEIWVVNSIGGCSKIRITTAGVLTILNSTSETCNVTGISFITP